MSVREQVETARKVVGLLRRIADMEPHPEAGYRGHGTHSTTLVYEMGKDTEHHAKLAREALGLIEGQACEGLEICGVCDGSGFYSNGFECRDCDGKGFF